MKFSGFQKLTLLDYPEHTACTVFTYGCNFRCPFCHNALLVTQNECLEEYDSEEVLAYLKKRAGILDGICITGGEPTLADGLFDFMRKVKETGMNIKLDTNGSNPDILIAAIEDGLCDYVAMDIKNSKELYGKTAGCQSLSIEPIEKSVSYLLSGKVDYEFRTTIVSELHSVESIENIAKWIQGAKRYFLQNFVDSGNLIENNLHAHKPETLEAMRISASKYIDFVGVRGI